MKNLKLWGSWLCACFLLTTAMSAQKKITGQILHSSSKQPIEYATVSVFSLDSVLVDGTVTDANGQFLLSLKKGNYNLQSGFLGFVTDSRTLEVTGNKNLGIIELAEDGLALKEVEVVAEQSQMTMQLDKKVFNVGKDLLSQGGSANEILENVPSVTVSAEGTVSLRGNSGVTILVNGRPSTLAANNSLENIPANSIEKVEVITNPSARYEASGNAGIINIILKKNQAGGLNGTLNLTAGIPSDYRPNFSFNYRKNKINLFGNVGFKYANYKGRGILNRASTIRDYTVDQTYKQDRNDLGGFGFAGFDYFIDDKNTITFSYSNYSVVNDDQTVMDIIYNKDNPQTATENQQILDYREPESYNKIDLNYTKTFDQKGKKLSISFQNDFWFNDETEETIINEIKPTETNLLTLYTNTDESSTDYLLQTDYVTPIGKNGTLEIGLRGETRIISSDYIAQSLVNNEWEVYKGLENRLDYYERIGAAYIQYGQKFEKFSYLLGLRNEYTYVKIDETIENNIDPKKYNQLFPTINLGYNFSKQTSTSLNFSRRIRRPSFWQLNPFGGLNNPNTIFSGNSDMNPAYTSRAELSLLQRWKKLNISSSIYYSVTTDYFDFYTTTDEDATVINYPVNLEESQDYGLEISTQFRPNKWFSLSTEFNFFGYSAKGQYLEQVFDNNNSSWRTRTRLQIRLPKEITFQSSTNYSAVYQDAFIERPDQWSMDIGLGKRMMNKKLNVNFNIRNIFDSRVRNGTSTFPTFTQYEEQAWNTRQYRLSLSYRFNKGGEKGARRERGSIR